MRHALYETLCLNVLYVLDGEGVLLLALLVLVFVLVGVYDLDDEWLREREGGD